MKISKNGVQRKKEKEKEKEKHIITMTIISLKLWQLTIQCTYKYVFWEANIKSCNFENVHVYMYKYILNVPTHTHAHKAIIETMTHNLSTQRTQLEHSTLAI